MVTWKSSVTTQNGLHAGAYSASTQTRTSDVKVTPQIVVLISGANIYRMHYHACILLPLKPRGNTVCSSVSSGAHSPLRTPRTHRRAWLPAAVAFLCETARRPVAQRAREVFLSAQSKLKTRENCTFRKNHGFNASLH